MQEDTKNNFLKEEEKVLAKIKVIVEFVTLYQKTNVKNQQGEEIIEHKYNKTEDEEIQYENAILRQTRESIENKEGNEINEKYREEIYEKVQDTCDDSWKESYENSQPITDSPKENSYKVFENDDSCSQMSKDSLVNEKSAEENYPRSPETPSKESIENPLFELDEGDDQFTSQSIECSAESEGVDYDSSLD